MVAVGVVLATSGALVAPALAGRESDIGREPGARAVERGDARGDDVRRVVFVGNNWDGTADLLAPGTFKLLGRIDVVPDYEARMREIATNPIRLAYFLAIREAIGEGNDQFVDDMYSSNDGLLVVISLSLIHI